MRLKDRMRYGIVLAPETGAGGGTATKTAAELYRELEQKRAEFSREWDKYPLKKLPSGEEAKDIPGDKIGVFRSLMEEVNAIGEKWQIAATAEKEQQAALDIERFGSDNARRLLEMGQPANRLSFGGDPGQQGVKSLGELFVNSPAFKNRIARGNTDGAFSLDDPDMSMKAMMDLGVCVKSTMLTTANGYPPQVLRNEGVTFSAQRPPQIFDTLPMIPTTQTSLLFMTETVFTNSAAATAEGNAAGEAVLSYDQTAAPLAWIPVFIPVSGQQLDDVPGLQGIINQRLMLMVKQTLDVQIAGGNGVNPNMKGFRSFAGVQTQARAADPAIDAIRKGIDKVNVTGRARANMLYMHSTDKMNLDLTKNAQGNYLFVNPLENGLSRIWGLPIIEQQVIAQGTSTVVDTDYIAVRMRSGIEISISDSHSDFFIKNLLAIRAAVRAGVEVYRGAAICDVTGL